jgi:hypothetical protein
VLTDSDDWANLFYDFAPGGDTAGMTPSEVVVCDNPAPM